MLRATLLALGSKTPRPSVKYDLIPRRVRITRSKLSKEVHTGSGAKEKDTAAGATANAAGASGGNDKAERIIGQGTLRGTVANELKDFIEKLEHPVVWVWYPWRRRPEPPYQHFPCPPALKNLHGAVWSDLSPVQKLRQSESYQHAPPPARDQQHEEKHPFLTTILKDLKGQPKGFPFWFKKYPTRRHAYEYRFSIPREMLDGYPKDVVTTLSSSCMTDQEHNAAERARYMERYAEHDLDVQSPAVVAVALAVKVRQLRNLVLAQRKNIIMQNVLYIKEQQLRKALRRLRKIDFRKYWEICNDHDVGEVIQPRTLPEYRWGSYWSYDWNNGLAISNQIADIMDPRGLTGCVETGRSRAEVARDLGLTYTRALNSVEKRQLADNAKYFERLAQFKNAQPEAFRSKAREVFVNKFSGMFAKANKYSMAVDFPSKYRGMVGNTVLRWRSARHGPM